MSLGTALAIFLPTIATIAGGGGSSPKKKGDEGGFLSDAASAFLKMGSGSEQPFQYMTAPERARSVKELTRGGDFRVQKSPEGGPVRFDYVDNTQFARVMRRLQDNAKNSQVRDMLYTYSGAVQPTDTKADTPQIKMTEVDIT